MTELGFDATRSIRRHIIAAGLIAIGLALTAGTWASMVPVSGAVVAQGLVVVDNYVKKVRPQNGGLVSKIWVRNGDAVGVGDVLISLDTTQEQSNLSILLQRQSELLARQARFLAERDGRNELEFPASLTQNPITSVSAEILDSEKTILKARAANRKGIKEQLLERIKQAKSQLSGLQAQLSANQKEARLVQSELDDLNELFKSGLMTKNRLNALERNLAQLQSAEGNLSATMAVARSSIAESKLQIMQLDSDHQKEVADELSKVQAELREIAERIRSSEDRIAHLELKAPQSGIVHELAVHAAGAFLAPGEQALMIVPTSEALVVEAMIAPQDIDHVIVGKSAHLRFSSFDFGTTPELSAKVSWVAADLSATEGVGRYYYRARLSISPNELRKLGDAKLLPGMPVEAFIDAGARSAWSYLSKPIADQVARAFVN